MRRVLGLTVTYVVLVVMAIIALTPSIWVILSSLKRTGQITSGAGSPLPDPLNLQGYVDAFTLIDFGRFLFNSLLYSVVGGALTIVVALLAAYPLTRFAFRGRNALIAAFSLALAVPVVGLATPEFFIMRFLHLNDSRIGMIIFYAAFMFPLAFVIFRAFLANLPRELEEAAVVDGAGYFRILGRVVVPVARPALATVGVISFVNIWNEFFFANLLISSAENRNVQVALSTFQGVFSSNVSAMLAGTTLVMIVPMIVFLLAQRHVIAGLTAGSIR